MRPTPIGDNYFAPSAGKPVEEWFNLDVMACTRCGHVQLLDVVSPELLYPEFPYVTSVSSGLPEHFVRMAERLLSEMSIEPGGLVVEIGSNEGQMLRAFKSRGMRVLGVEPASAIAKAAVASGVPTLPRFFDSALANSIRATEGPASVIAANNVLANIDDLHDVFAGARTLLAPDGVMVIESSYWGDVVTGGLIDTIYHEHISYFSVRPLAAFLLEQGLQLIDVGHNSNKGGSLRLVLQHLGGPRAQHPSVPEALAREQALGLHTPAIEARCRAWLDDTRAHLGAEVDKVMAAGGKVAGFGASVGTTTQLIEFGLEKKIHMLFDENPRKFGKLSPGLHIPVIEAKELADSEYALAVQFAWRYSDAIRSRIRGFEARGGRWLLPFPKPTLL